MQNKFSSLLLKIKRWPTGLALLILAAAAVTKWQASQLPDNVKVPPPDAPVVTANQYFAEAESLHGRASNLSPADYKRLISIVDAGVNFPNTNPRWKVGDKDDVQHLQMKERFLCSDIRKAGDYFAARRDYNDAIRAYVDLVKIGAVISNSGGLEQIDIGEGFEIGGRAGLYSILNSITGSQAEVVARQLFEVNATRRPLSRILLEDKYATQTQLLAAFRTNDWRDRIYVWMGSTRSRQSDFVDRFDEGIESPRQAFESYTDYMDRRTRLADNPWSQIKDEHVSPPTDIAGNILTQFEQAVPLSGISAITRWTAALDNLIATQFALKAYRIETGNDPGTLRNLVPEYLPSIPRDPFTNSSSLKYKVRGHDRNDYILYSIGPDGIDNGGRRISSGMLSNEQGTADVSSVMTQLYINPKDVTGDIVVTSTAHPTDRRTDSSSLLDTLLREQL